MIIFLNIFNTCIIYPNTFLTLNDHSNNLFFLIFVKRFLFALYDSVKTLSFIRVPTLAHTVVLSVFAVHRFRSRLRIYYRPTMSIWERSRSCQYVYWNLRVGNAAKCCPEMFFLELFLCLDYFQNLLETWICIWILPKRWDCWVSKKHFQNISAIDNNYNIVLLCIGTG